MTAIRRRVWAIVCAVTLLLCVPLVRPWLDMGTMDDISYTRSAQLLAETGHIIYNGWAAPILGWHLYWGALFIKLFGFSFNVTRLSTLPIAMAAAFLSQRAMVRAGLTERNATLATLTFILSPLFLPLAFTYMTDIGGYFVLLLCFYACIRALQAETDLQACGWIAFAAISNSIGGTIRQTGWMGLLLIIPSTLWLLRARTKVLLCGLVSIAVGLAIVAGIMAWHKHQPYAISEPLWRGPLTADLIRNTVRSMAKTIFDAPLFLLPVLLVFLPRVRSKGWRSGVAFLTGCAILLGLGMLIERHPGAWLEPSMGNSMSPQGVLSANDIDGTRPAILTEGIRIALTGLVIAGLSAFAVAMWGSRAAARQSKDVLPWSSLLVLAVPFSAIYLLSMTSRAGINMVFDRYLLPLLFLSLLFIVRFYQERVSRQLPGYTVVMLAIAASFSVAETHDAFAMLRARLAAAQELQARGVPNTEIDGGWQFNFWTQLTTFGFLKPQEEGVALPLAPTDPALACEPIFAASTPGLHPEYALSYDPNGCGGQIGVPAVRYREWLGPREVSIYVVSSRREPVREATGN
jgi:hypothetical protein